MSRARFYEEADRHSAHAAALSRTWSDPPTFLGWLCTNDHKAIGRRFVVTAFVFFIAAGLLAAVMRAQLAFPGASLVGPDFYNQLFTVHGTAMMFLFAVPMMQGMSVYLIPLMIGTRNTAFPRMTSCSYWIYLIGGLTLFGAFAVNTGADAGWFAYVPLAGPQYGIGKRADFWNALVTFTEAMGLMVAVDIATTILKLRAPGMSLRNMPVFVWASLVTAFMIIFAMPAVMLAANLVQLDRMVDTHFFNPAEGGDPLLWQHLFWFFGHPEVYFIFVPALGFISEIVPTFARRPMFGHDTVVLSVIATGFLSFGLWVHHMFATNLPELGKSFFTAMSFVIAIPTAAQIFCWIATLWNGRLNIRSPLLFILGFFVVLLIGGLTGLMLGSVPLDLQVHDTYFVVAHLHYVLIGGAVFPLFAAIFYWFPKFTGRMLQERLGRWQFWLFFIGVNVAFFPMHELGLHGMPRRIYTYAEDMGWGTLNLVSTIGAAIIALSVALFLVNVVISLRKGEQAPNNPWGAATLEWAAQSPPPAYNFASLPVVPSRNPLWSPGTRGPTHVTGLSTQAREGLATTVLDAVPDVRYVYPRPTIWAFVAAVTVGGWLLWSIYSLPGILWGMIPPAIAFTAWYWPRKKEALEELKLELRPAEKTAKIPASVAAKVRDRAVDVSNLPSYGFSHRSLMWWGNAGMISIEAVAFGFMIVIYFYLRSLSETPAGVSPTPNVLWGTVNLGIILLSAIPNKLANRAAIAHDARTVRIALIVLSLLTLSLCGVRMLEFTALNVRWDDSAYGSVIWTLLGLHTFNLVTDCGDTLVLTAVMFKKPLEGKRFVDIAENSGYWDFIVLSWIPIYAVIYWAPSF